MTVVKHEFNPRTGKLEVVGVVSDILGLYGKPTINVSGSLLYNREDLKNMDYDVDKLKIRDYSLNIPKE